MSTAWVLTPSPHCQMCRQVLLTAWQQSVPLTAHKLVQQRQSAAWTTTGGQVNTLPFVVGKRLLAAENFVTDDALPVHQLLYNARDCMLSRGWQGVCVWAHETQQLPGGSWATTHGAKCDSASAGTDVSFFRVIVAVICRVARRDLRTGASLVVVLVASRTPHMQKQQAPSDRCSSWQVVAAPSRTARLCGACGSSAHIVRPHPVGLTPLCCGRGSRRPVFLVLPGDLRLSRRAFCGLLCLRACGCYDRTW